ncbi:MAG: LamG domain-containing protein [Planctomycetes bacterium]|nr:LamG domain-containing protein [Planctomycetota bacterium]
MKMRVSFTAGTVLALLVITKSLVPGEVAHWTLAEGPDGATASGTGTILDVSGNQHHGTPYGGPVYTAACGGEVGLLFDGSDDRVFVPDAPAFALTQSLTLEAVVRVDSLNPSPDLRQFVFRGDDLGGLDPYYLAVVPSTGRLKFLVQDATNASSELFSPSPLPLGTVVHVAGTLDHATGEQRLYVDRVLVVSTITSIRPYGLLTGPSPGLGIGSTQGTLHKQCINGAILDVRISDQALEPHEMLTTCCPGSSHAYGSGCPGWGGFVPELGLQGCPSPAVSIALSLSSARPQSVAIHLMGLFESSLPAAGGCTLNVFPVSPLVFALPLAGDPAVAGSGGYSVVTTIPANLQPASVKLQAFVADSANSWGYSASNGLSIAIN